MNVSRNNQFLSAANNDDAILLQKGEHKTLILMF